MLNTTGTAVAQWYKGLSEINPVSEPYLFVVFVVVYSFVINIF